MAGVGWYPFVSSVRDKNNPLQNYSGYYINNCLQYQNGKLFHHLNTTEQRKDAMKKTELLSMFTSEKYISDNYVSTPIVVHLLFINSIGNQKILLEILKNTFYYPDFYRSI